MNFEDTYCTRADIALLEKYLKNWQLLVLEREYSLISNSQLILFFYRLKLPIYEVFEAWCKMNQKEKEQNAVRKSTDEYKKQRSKLKSQKFHQEEKQEFWYGHNNEAISNVSSC